MDRRAAGAAPDRRGAEVTRPGRPAARPREEEGEMRAALEARTRTAPARREVAGEARQAGLRTGLVIDSIAGAGSGESVPWTKG